MYCNSCGQPLPHTHRPPLERPREGRKIAGVCLGIARHLDVDPTLVRVVAVILVFIPPAPAIIAYIIAWVVMPEEPVRSEVARPVST